MWSLSDGGLCYKRETWHLAPYLHFISDPLWLGLTSCSIATGGCKIASTARKCCNLSPHCPSPPSPFCVMPGLCWFSLFLFFSFKEEIERDKACSSLTLKPVFSPSRVTRSELPSPCLPLIGSSYKLVPPVRCHLCTSWSKKCIWPGWRSAKIAWWLYCS